MQGERHVDNMNVQMYNQHLIFCICVGSLVSKYLTAEVWFIDPEWLPTCRLVCFIVAWSFFLDLEVFQQASAGDFAAVDLLHVDVTRTEEPGDQNLQVVDELAIDF